MKHHSLPTPRSPRTPRALGAAAFALVLVVLLAPSALQARPPLFELRPISSQVIEATTPFHYQVEYEVRDETCWLEVIHFSLGEGPAGMTITAGGSLDWTPARSEAGKVHDVTVLATAPKRSGAPCNGGSHQSAVSFSIAVTAPPQPDPPTAAIDVELTEAAINNALASLIEVRGINFGDYLAGFVDAWWVNLDAATVDVLPPSGPGARARLSASATANAVFDLFIIKVPLGARASGWIEGDVGLAGDAQAGYTVTFRPTDAQWLIDTIVNLAGRGPGPIPEIELNFGAPLGSKLGCRAPTLTTNHDDTALVLEWDLADLDCDPQQQPPPPID